MKVHSLSSYSAVRGSLNRVTETSLFSGTGHITTPLSGLFNVGSHGNGSVATRRLLRHQTMLTLFGVLHRKFELIRRLKGQRQIKRSTYLPFGSCFQGYLVVRDSKLEPRCSFIHSLQSFPH